MKDSRIVELAKNIVNYSLELKPGEKVLIETIGFELQLTKELIKEIYKIGAYPYVTIKNSEITRLLFSKASEIHTMNLAGYEVTRMKEMDAYIGIRCNLNNCELSGLVDEQIKMYSLLFQKPVHTDVRVPKTKWIVLSYPTDSMAQSANMSTEIYEDFYFNVCNLDYSKMSKAMVPLEALITKTDNVRIIAKDTDLTFSLSGMPGIKCAGKMNLPDGEVFSAPVRNSVNGYISINTTSLFNGFRFENIRLGVENGKIVEADSNNNERLKQILDTDAGSRYFGEFALGTNPYIETPIQNIFFDEKINGSIHFAIGNSYEICDNGNKSAIHWDLILIQRPDHGGGEIWFDDVLIRKDGIFIPEELKPLNPENLK